MLDKIYIIDFDDSFTYNIANVLYSKEPSIQVIHYKVFFKDVYLSLLNSKELHAVILGPGPGHPDDYQDVFEAVKLLLNCKRIYILGICLGHQILGMILGYAIKKSHEAIHGQQVEIEFKGQKFQVQRYNSLCVYDQNKELPIIKYPSGISYQFHPESIGTTQKDIFFKDLINFLDLKTGKN